MTPAAEPLLRLAYTLTTADALAYESRPREIVGWRRWAFLVWLAGAGMVLALLPDDWVGPEWGWRFWLIGAVLVGLAWLIATAAMTLAAHRRARRRVPAPTAVELLQWGDHLEVVADGQRSFVAYETIAAVSTGPAHIFVTAPPEAIVIPERAFESRDEMRALADYIDRLSAESVP